MMTETFSLTNPGIELEKPKINRPCSPQKLIPVPKLEDSPKIMQKTKNYYDENQQRIWKNQLKKINFDVEADYYDNFPIQPGYNFYKALIECKTNPSEHNINLPATYIVSGYNSHYLYTDNQGKLQKIQNENYKVFEDKIIEDNQQIVQKIESKFSLNRNFNENLSYQQLAQLTNFNTNPEAPFVVEKFQSSNLIHETQKFVQNYKTHTEKKGQYDQQKIYQQYVHSKSMVANTMRLVYYTKNNMGNQGTIGYLLQNYKGVWDGGIKISLNKKTCICSDQQDSFDITKIQGQILEKYIQMSSEVVKYLEKNYPIRIHQIVLDYVTDFFGNIYLVGCRHINMENCSQMCDYLAQRQETVDCQKPLDQLTCSQTCKLCGINFKKCDVEKTLTYKLINEFILHLAKRNIQISGFQVHTNSTKPCRVCTLCYMVVVSEHELIEVEQKFAEKQAIPIYDPVFRVGQINQQPKSRPALLTPKLYQWRLAFYFTDIQDLLKSNVDQKTLFLQYKLHNQKSEFSIHSKNLHQTKRSRCQSAFGLRDKSSDTFKTFQVSFTPQNDIQLDKLRTHYFFSETEDIYQFLSETYIEIRLTQGTNWDNFVAEGSSKTVSHFDNKEKRNQRHSSQVFMFFDDSKYCTLNFHAGLVCDGQFDTGSMNLYKYNGIYFPDETYYTGNPMPDIWMELFDVNYIYKKEEIIENADIYAPKCNLEELNQMITFKEPKISKQYKQVTSKLQTRTTRSRSEYQQNEYNLIENKMKKIKNWKGDDSTTKLLNKNLQNRLNSLTNNTNTIIPASNSDSRGDYKGFSFNRQKHSQYELSGENKNLLTQELIDILENQNNKRDEKYDQNSKRQTISTSKLETRDTHRIMLSKSIQNTDEMQIIRQYDMFSDNNSQFSDNPQQKKVMRSEKALKNSNSNYNQNINPNRVQSQQIIKKEQNIDEKHKNYLENVRKQKQEINARKTTEQMIDHFKQVYNLDMNDKQFKKPPKPKNSGNQRNRANTNFFTERNNLP